ncbi:MAG: hypothetical protein JO111_03420 [Caulobacteraceae bacterium]|nr:hypothetical protein [Caulobacteraceae bacterium]
MLATASQALAQSAPAPASAPIPAAPGAPSVESTTIGDLMANPAAKAVLQKDMPQLVSYPGLDQIKDMTLRAISVYPEAQLDDAKLKAIQTDFNSAAATKP